jgi:fructan beta-fructosidase
MTARFYAALLSLSCVLVLWEVCSMSAGGYYTERYRPQYHFTPEKNFMNDPNGMVYYKGEYHLFYQYNPFGNVWGHMSWGHAISPDMVHWKHLPVALKEENGIMIFSGSAVVDAKNSSGLGAGPGKDGCLVAIYTGHTETRQTQNIAFSNDAGRTWTKYAKNPVVDIGKKDFRDPKVIWHEPTGKWVMVTVLPDEHKVRFYGSKNLKNWDHLSDFGPAGATGGIWECPDLFDLPVDGEPGRRAWVLKVDLNPGAIAGGSGGQYFVGEFDGTRFRSAAPDGETLWIDYGPDFYASQSWFGAPSPDGRRFWLGWMSNWLYANVAPTDPWRSAQSIPRAVMLKAFPEGMRLVQSPVAELQSLRGRQIHLAKERVTGANTLLASKGVTGEALEIVAEFALDSASEFGLKVRTGKSEETIVGYDVAKRQVFVDRTRSGDVRFSESFAGKHGGPLAPENGRVKLHVFVDRASVEVFANDGRTVITSVVFPSADSLGAEVYAKGGSVELASLDAWTLGSAWGAGQ